MPRIAAGLFCYLFLLCACVLDDASPVARADRPDAHAVPCDTAGLADLGRGRPNLRGFLAGQRRENDVLRNIEIGSGIERGGAELVDNWVCDEHDALVVERVDRGRVRLAVRTARIGELRGRIEHDFPLALIRASADDVFDRGVRVHGLACCIGRLEFDPAQEFSGIGKRYA